MKSSDSNNWLIPLLAAFAIYVPLSSTSPSQDQQSSGQPQSPTLIQMVPLATPAPAATPGRGRVSGEAAKLLCEFFGAKPDLNQDAQGRISGRKQTQPNTPQDFDPKNLRGDYGYVTPPKVRIVSGSATSIDKNDLLDKIDWEGVRFQMLLTWAFLRFTWLWAALRRLLRRLSWRPLISQYAAEHSEELSCRDATP